MADVNRWLREIAQHDRLLAEKLQVSNGCLVFTGYCNHGGYGKVHRDGGVQFAHRYLWAVLNGEISAGMSVCHSCDNPPCCNPDHLFLGAHRDNMQDMVAKGRGRWPGKKGKIGMRGVLNPRAKLAVQDVEWIRKNHSPKHGSDTGTMALAKKYGVSRSTILSVVKGQTWRAI